MRTYNAPKDPKAAVAVFTAALADPHVSYRLCKDIDGYGGDGTFMLAWQRVASRFGVRARQVFYEPLSTYDQIFGAEYVNGRLCEGGAPEWAGNFVTITFRHFASAYAAPQGRLLLPAQGDPDKGLHAVFVSGWEDHGESLLFVNSWGTGWGDRGWGTVTREYLDRYLNDAWLRRLARVGPSAFIWSRILAATSDKALARAWMMENPRWRQRIVHAGRRYELQLFQTLSFVDDCPVEVIEVRTGHGFRVAWAHLFHLGSAHPGTCLLKEFYVWPTYRGRGVGSLLESVVTERARERGNERIQVFLHDIDDAQGVLSPGRKFGEKCGCRWRWGRYVRPNLKAIGEKTC